MQKNKIVANDVEYAVGWTGSGDYDVAQAVKAVVVDKDATYKTHVGSWGQVKKDAPGIRIRVTGFGDKRPYAFRTHDEIEVGTEKVVPSRQIIRPWAEHQAEIDARAEGKRNLEISRRKHGVKAAVAALTDKFDEADATTLIEALVEADRDSLKHLSARIDQALFPPR